MPQKNTVKKIIPSRLETGFQQFLYKHVGKHIPESMTPNRMTLIGALGGLFAIICTLLTHISPFFFLRKFSLEVFTVDFRTGRLS